MRGVVMHAAGAVRPSPRTGSAGLLLALALAGCATAGAPTGGAAPSTSSVGPAPVPHAGPSTTPPVVEAEGAPTGGPAADAAEGTMVRFSTPDASVDVTLGPETPTTADLVSLMPFTMRLEEFAGREKIGDPPRELDVEGTPGSDPVDGDLIYFTPWGNLGFYYDASGIGYSDETPHLGTYEATEEQLSRLEGEEVTVAVLEP